MLVLASASPRRKDLLARVGLALEVRPSDIDETELPGETPSAYVARIARGKAAVVDAPGAWVIAADTTVTIDGAILAKAADGDEAAAMLRRLVGRTHQVMTGFVVRAPDGRVHEQVVTTDVVMVAAGEDRIAGYVASGEWQGKAGAYALQGIAAALVAEVRGSVTNVIGLPLAEVIAALDAMGGPRADFAAGSAV